MVCTVADMEENDPVVEEVRYWLDRDEYGLLSAVARLAKVTPTSVSGWATGTSRPIEGHWPALEEAFGQRAGHLKRIANGEIEPRTTPIEVTVPRPSGGLTPVGRPAGAPRGTAGIDSKLDELLELVHSLESNVLLIAAAVLPPDQSDSTPGGGSVRRSPSKR